MILRCQSRGGTETFAETRRDIEGILELLRKAAGVLPSSVDKRYRLTFFVRPARGVSLISARFWIRDFLFRLTFHAGLGGHLSLALPCFCLGLGLGSGSHLDQLQYYSRFGNFSRRRRNRLGTNWLGFCLLLVYFEFCLAVLGPSRSRFCL